MYEDQENKRKREKGKGEHMVYIWEDWVYKLQFLVLELGNR